MADFEAQPSGVQFDDEPLAGSSSNASSAYSLHSMAPHHPVAAIFHVLWKLLAILLYLFCEAPLGMTNFVLIFIIIVLLLVADFWTTKNVTGRLLVGLRWWNEVREDGSTHWVFESREDQTRVHKGEYRIFWGALFLTTTLWALFGIWNVLSIKSLFNPRWLLIILVALGLSCANLVGYVKCARGMQQDLQKRWDFANQVVSFNS